MAIVAPVENGKIVDTTSEETKASKGNELGYDQFLQLLCAEMQYQDPLEPTTNTEYVAQLATFSQMEATLSMQSTLQNSNANALVGKYVVIHATSSTTGETTAVAGFVDYVEYKNGKPYVAVNGNTYSVDNIYSVADTEYMEAITYSEAFKASVAALPEKDKLTLAYQADIENLRKVYDSLTSYQQSYIDTDTLSKFAELETKMKEMVTAAEEVAADFKASVEKLPSVDEITLDSKEEVEKLRKTYEAYNEYQKAFVDKDVLKTFEALEAKIKELAGTDTEGGADGGTKTE